jgi:hypothetical protein
MRIIAIVLSAALNFTLGWLAGEGITAIKERRKQNRKK